MKQCVNLCSLMFLFLILSPTLRQKKRSSLQKNAASPASSSSIKSIRLRKRGSDGTPPLTPDKADDDSGVTVKEESPNPQTLSSPPPQDLSSQPQTPSATPVREDDLEFEEYLLKSRRKLMREFSPQAFESWKSWSWSQLKEPVWVVASYPNQQMPEGTPAPVPDAVAGQSLTSPAESGPASSPLMHTRR